MPLFSVAESRDPYDGIPDLTDKIVWGPCFPADGGFSNLYLGFFKDDTNRQKQLALKVLRVASGDNAQTAKDRGKIIARRFPREANILHAQTKLGYEHVINFFGICTRPDNQDKALIMEYMRNGCVLEYIRHNTIGKDGIAHLAIDIATGLYYLHANGVVHGDLRGRNILVNEQKKAVISDFGRSFIQGTDQCTKSLAGAPKWVAPEVLLMEEENDFDTKMTTSADIWSLAMTITELYTDLEDTLGSVRATTAQILGRYLRKELPAVKTKGRNKDVPEQLWSILYDCWSYDPAARPEAGVVRVRVSAALAS